MKPDRPAPAAPVEGFWLLLTEDEAIDLASGFVPSTVKAQILGLLDFDNELRRAAARPIRTTTNTTKKISRALGEKGQSVSSRTAATDKG